MKIKNVEKFREALYKAIDDSFVFEWINTPIYTWKDGHEPSKFAEEIPDFDENKKCISLPHPLHVRGSKIWMTIDHDGDALFWLSTPTHFKYLCGTMTSLYDTQMAYAIAIADDLKNLMARYDNDEPNIDRIEV